MNPFDRIIMHLSHTVTETFGEVAVWFPRNGGEALSGKVLFKDPSKEDKTGRLAGSYADVETMPALPYIEYYKGAFPGLRESVAAGNHEVLEINAIQYVVMTVPKIWDGNTYKAELQEI